LYHDIENHTDQRWANAKSHLTAKLIPVV